jgi:hypothetical protein
MKTSVHFCLFFIILSLNVNAQFLTASQVKALDSLQKLKPLFQKTLDDSVFVSKYSEGVFQIYFFRRGDHATDIDEQIYSANVGDVVGPFRGYDGLNYIFKIMSYDDYTIRSRANLIFLKPNDESKQDSASVAKLTEKYLELSKKGKDIKIRAFKEDIRLIIQDLNWYYEGENEKQYYEQLFSMTKGEAVMLDTKNGPALLIITNSKERTPSSVRTIGIMKKG